MPRNLTSGNAILTVPELKESNWGNTLNEITFPTILKYLDEIYIARGLYTTLNDRLNTFITNSLFVPYQAQLDSILSAGASLRDYILWSNYPDAVVQGNLNVDGTNVIPSPDMYVNSRIAGVYKIVNPVNVQNISSGIIYTSGNSLYYLGTTAGYSLDDNFSLASGSVAIAAFTSGATVTVYPGALKRELILQQSSVNVNAGTTLLFSGHFHYNVRNLHILAQVNELVYDLTSVAVTRMSRNLFGLDQFEVYFNWHSDGVNSGLFFSGNTVQSLSNVTVTLKIYG